MNEITTTSNHDLIASAYSLEAVHHQVQLIQSLMSKVLKEGEHYGKIPGTTKPTLFKPGAEKINMLFRLSSTYRTVERVFSDSLIYYQIECTLTHSPSNQIVATGLGSCNSNETKYKYKLVETTKKPSKEEAARLKALGEGKWKQQKSVWTWFDQVKNDNPYELDNTLLKMACKRALIAATLNATAASDIFTQDLEDLPPSHQNSENENEEVPKQPSNQNSEIPMPPPSGLSEVTKAFIEKHTKEFQGALAVDHLKGKWLIMSREMKGINIAPTEINLILQELLPVKDEIKARLEVEEAEAIIQEELYTHFFEQLKNAQGGEIEETFLKAKQELSTKRFEELELAFEKFQKAQKNKQPMGTYFEPGKPVHEGSNYTGD